MWLLTFDLFVATDYDYVANNKQLRADYLSSSFQPSLQGVLLCSNDEFTMLAV